MTDLLPIGDMTPRLVTTLQGNPGRVMQSFVRAPWSGEYFEAQVESGDGGTSDLRISRCDSTGKRLDYAILDGAGHGSSITAEYSDGKVWIWLFWGADVNSAQGDAVRWAYQGTPSGARVLEADTEPVADPGIGAAGHTYGKFAIDQASDRVATAFRSGSTETFALYKLSDYKAAGPEGTPPTALKTATVTWPAGSSFQGFTITDTRAYISRGGSAPGDVEPTLYELDWATGAIVGTKDISGLAAVAGDYASGGHNEAEGVCLYRDQAGNPELLFGIVTGPIYTRQARIYSMKPPVDGTSSKTLLLDVEHVTGEAMTNAEVTVSYDRTVRHTDGGMTPKTAADKTLIANDDRVQVYSSDHESLTDDSYGFFMYVKINWDDPTNPGQRRTATYTAQVSAAAPDVVALSQVLVADGAAAPGQIVSAQNGVSVVGADSTSGDFVFKLSNNTELNAGPVPAAIVSDSGVAAVIGSAQTKEALDQTTGGLVGDAASDTYGALAGGFITQPRGAHVFDLAEPRFTGDNPSARLQDAVTKLATGSNTDAILNISADFTLTAPITWNSRNVSLNFNGHKVDASAITTGAAFRVSGSAGVGTEPALARRFLSNLRLVGPGKTSAGSVGLDVSGLSGQPTHGIKFDGVEIEGFAKGILASTQAYLLTWTNANITGCGTGVHMPSGGTNYGENLRFISGCIGSCDIGIQNDNANGEITLVGTSVDFCLVPAIANAGQIHMTAPHIELSISAANAVTAPILQTGADTSALITVANGKVLVDNPTYFTPATLFTTANTKWGGGIRLTDTHLYALKSTTGFMCGGTGLLETSGLSTTDTYQGADVLTHRSANLLIDGNFAVSPSVDALVANTGATSRVASPNLDLSVASAKLTATKKVASGQSAIVTAYVPCRRGREYAAAVTLAAVATSGDLLWTEGFVASTSLDSAGRPALVSGKRYARGASTVALTSGVVPSTLVGSSTNWNRRAPGWATHFYVQIDLTSCAAGSIDLSEIVVTDR